MLPEKKIKLARSSFSRTPYECAMPWPEDCSVQCGENGIVVSSGSLDAALKSSEKAAGLVDAVLGSEKPRGAYLTAFFEAFPQNPRCFIRGEGLTVADAEKSAWDKYQKILSCDHKEFDRRGREDGYAYCTKCPYSATLLQPLTSCEACGKPARYAMCNRGKWYCRTHYYKLDYSTHIKGKELYIGETEESAFSSFVMDGTRDRLISESGLSPEGDLYTVVCDMLLRAEAWDKELDRRARSKKKRSASNLEADYVEAFPRLLSWIEKRLPDEYSELRGVVRRMLATTEGK